MSTARVGQMMKRIPLIKFRYVKAMNAILGTTPASDIPIPMKTDLTKAIPQSGLNQSIGISSSSTTPVSKQSTPAIEFHQLPQRYRRAVISDYEMDVINNGGHD